MVQLQMAHLSKAGLQLCSLSRCIQLCLACGNSLRQLLLCQGCLGFHALQLLLHQLQLFLSSLELKLGVLCSLRLSLRCILYATVKCMGKRTIVKVLYAKECMQKCSWMIVLAGS